MNKCDITSMVLPAKRFKLGMLFLWKPIDLLKSITFWDCISSFSGIADPPPLMIMLSTTNKARTTKLAKALLTAGLLGGTAFSVLSAGLASAKTSFAWNDVFSASKPFSFQLGDKIFSNFLTNIDNQSLASIDFDIVGNVYDINADFESSNLLDSQDYFSYDVTIAQPGTYFDDVYFAYQQNLGSTGVAQKEIYNGSTLLGTLGNTQAITLTNNYTTLRVVDSITAGGSFDSMTNNYTQRVPGPLPLLGAGAAFGFSRRLRSRIKKTSLA